MRRVLLSLALSLPVVGLSTNAHAQADTMQVRALAWSVEVGAGSAPNDLDLPLNGTLVLLGARWERSIVRTGRLSVSFAPEVMPYASLRGAVRSVSTQGGICQLVCPPLVINVVRTDATGIGVAPVALRAAWRVTDRATVTASTRMSALLLDERAPLPAFGAPTYMLDASLGVRLGVSDAMSLNVEWVRASIANGNFILDDRAMKTSGVRLGLSRTSVAQYPRITRDSAGTFTTGWVLSAGAGAFSPLIGFQRGAQMSTVAWHWERVIAGDADLALMAGVELLPLVLARANKLVLPGRARCTLGPCPVIDSYETPAVGAGLSPIVLRVRGVLAPRVHAWTETTAGGVAFDRPYPVRDANRLNFLLSVGAGVSVGLSDTRALAVGYRFQHLSNGFTASRNPGVNFHALTLGLQLLR